MISKRKNLSAATLATLLGVGMVPVIEAYLAPAHAQLSEEEERRRQRLSLTTSTAKVLGEVFNQINSDDFPGALEALNRLLERDLPPFDEATARELRGGVYAQMGNYAASLRDYVRIIELDTLPSDRMKQIRYNVAQLYFAEEDYPSAIRFIRQYLDSGNVEDSNAWYILAAAYVSQGDYRNARVPAENVVRYDTKNEKKNYDLLNLIYSELSLNVERGQLLERMVQLFPNEETYWAQLSGAYAQAGRDKDAFATLEAAYKAGLIKDEPKIVALAQYYSALDNPYRGALLIEREMANGTVKRSLRNLELLAQLWSMSREQEKAIAILREAAKLSDNGELYYRLGQSYVANEQYEEAISNLRQALQKGGLSERDRGDIYLLIGSSYFNLDSETRAGRRRAREAFQQAARYSTSARDARGWITYIDAIQQTIDAQDEVERIQREEQRRREIERCETLQEVADLGGNVDRDSLATCATLLAQAAADEEAGETEEEEDEESDEDTSEETPAEGSEG